MDTHDRTTEIKELHALIGRVAAMEARMVDIQDTLHTYVETVRNVGKTNWGTVIAAIGLLVVVWAAAINPLSANVTKLEVADTKQDARREKFEDMLMQLMELTTQSIAERKAADTTQQSDLTELERRLNFLNEHGATDVNKRLGIIEFRLDLYHKGR